MEISGDFKDAVAQKDILTVRILLKDSLVYDPTCRQFDAMLSYAESRLQDLYEEHDGEVFSRQEADWEKEYMNRELANVLTNFSRERLMFLKELCRYVYRDEAETTETEKSKEPISGKQMAGAGLVAAGAAAAVVGYHCKKPLITAAGVAAAVAGGILIVTDR